jgi:hypothetical protein
MSAQQLKNRIIYTKQLRIFAFIFLALISLPESGIAQTDTAYSFLVAGHAYGAHEGENLGLHPLLLSSLDEGFDSLASFIVLTGDIVNQSTAESWAQVEAELAAYPFESFYVMGNHDANSAGYDAFEAKHAATYYSFYVQSELYIVLNSTIEQRSISEDQLDFLAEEIEVTGAGLKNVFIFFHEVLWNSHEKYIDVRSNSRSRYDQIVNYSNYWEDVHPILLSHEDKNFYVIAGDVGGNPDAISIFYDRWDNVTLIASGMGEVPDENYLTVCIHNSDSIEFSLVPLRPDISLQDLTYYSVPGASGPVQGPENVMQGESGVLYSVPPVFNATEYLWDLPEGVSGSGTNDSILLDFSDSFLEGDLSVSAARDGYGSGPAGMLHITAEISALESLQLIPEMQLYQDGQSARIELYAAQPCELNLKFCSVSGQVLDHESYLLDEGDQSLLVDLTGYGKGIYFLTVDTGNAPQRFQIIIH